MSKKGSGSLVFKKSIRKAIRGKKAAKKARKAWHPPEGFIPPDPPVRAKPPRGK